jgi:hypothetical protein
MNSRLSPRDDVASAERPQATGGWLLVLCALLLVWQPLTLAIGASRALDALPVRGPGLLSVLLLRLLTTAFGIAAGLALLRRHPGAVGLAKLSLVLSALSDLVTYSTRYFPNNRPPGTTGVLLVASLAYYTIWLAYLFGAKRARES